MTIEGHLIFAIASAVFAKRSELTPELANGDWWHIVPAMLLTCLLPDIDHPKSTLGQRFRWISHPISRIFGHRGFTHSLLATLGIIQLNLCLNDQLIPVDIVHGMILGYLSHIIADMLTPSGVPLLWPCRWRFRIPILITASNNQIERVFCLILVASAFLFKTDPLYLWMSNLLEQFMKIIQLRPDHLDSGFIFFSNS